MKYSIVILSFLMVACHSKKENKNGSEDRLITLEEIIKANTDQLGEVDIIDGVNAIEVISLKKEASYNDSIVFVADRNGRMRIDIYDRNSDTKERVFSESYDGSEGYQWSPAKGQEAASEKGKIALSHTTQYPGHILQLKDMKSAGHNLQLVDSESIDGALYHIIALTLSDGFKSYYYLDANSFLISKIRSKRALHVDIDSTQQLIEVQHLNHKKIKGITKPFKIIETDIVKDTLLMESVILEYNFNPSIADRFYRDLTTTVFKQ